MRGGEISGGTVRAAATGNGSNGIASHSGVSISGGEVTAVGPGGGIYGTVKNSVPGTGWTDVDGTQGETAIARSADGQTLTSYKKVHFPGPAATVTTPPYVSLCLFVGTKFPC